MFGIILYYILRVLKFILTILVFVALKIFELLRFLFWRPWVIMIKKWKTTLTSLGVFAALYGLAVLALWIHQTYSIELKSVLLLYMVVIVIGLLITLIYSLNKFEINRFFARNWEKATNIIERIM